MGAVRTAGRTRDPEASARDRVSPNSLYDLIRDYEPPEVEWTEQLGRLAILDGFSCRVEISASKLGPLFG